MDSSTHTDSGPHADRLETSEPPEPVAKAISLIWWAVGVSILYLLVSFFLMDDLVDRAIDNRFWPRRGEVDPDSIRRGIHWNLGIGFVATVSFAAFFAFFLQKRANWARFAFAAVSLGGIALTLLDAMASAPPTPLIGIQVCLGLLSLWAIVLLFRPESRRFFAPID